MTRQKTNRITVWLLVIGLGGALVILLTAAPDVVDPLLGDQFADKKYLREMRVIGGQGNVLAAEFNDWFAGLWHGRELAATVAVLTVVAVLGFRFVATHPDAETVAPATGTEKEKPPGTG